LAYWWVSQNRTYKHEKEGGYLWAPKIDRAGNTPFHWENMLKVKPGDLIFSYKGQKIVSISIAKTSAYDSPRPEQFSQEIAWNEDGYKIDSDYQDLNPPIILKNVIQDLMPLLPSQYSPITRTGAGMVGYLFSIPSRAGQFLLRLIPNGNGFEIINSGIRNTVPTQTERNAIIQSRIGQGKFREKLMNLWGSQCCLTGVRIQKILRASHIKPWSDSNNEERLDTYNGLLLSPVYDALFDAGLITFEDNGQIKMSAALTPREASKIGVTGAEKIHNLSEKHLHYLRYHRQEVFEKNH
jgi:hypothetical protein